MNKTDILQNFISSIEAELAVLKKSAKDTADYATDSENKPENKYDTRGLEASYLAGAQAVRVAEMQEVLLAFRHQILQNNKKTEIVTIGALVEVSIQDKISFLLIMPVGGGQSIKYENRIIQVVTPVSPLGQALLKRTIGDLVTITTGNAMREYEIISIL